MKNRRIELSRSAWAVLVLGIALGSSSALAAKKTGADDALATYRQERALCLSGQSNQDRATCLREAGAALVEARRGGLTRGSSQYASKRCERLPDAERQDCLARMQGQGTTSGSVAAGGISRELVTRTVGAPTAAEPARAASDPAAQ